MPNQQLPEKLHKTIIRKLKNLKNLFLFSFFYYLGCLPRIYAVISKYHKGLWFLLLVIDIFCKYAWIGLFRDKKLLQLLEIFKKL